MVTFHANSPGKSSFSSSGITGTRLFFYCVHITMSHRGEGCQRQTFLFPVLWSGAVQPSGAASVTFPIRSRHAGGGGNAASERSRLLSAKSARLSPPERKAMPVSLDSRQIKQIYSLALKNRRVCQEVRSSS